MIEKCFSHAILEKLDKTLGHDGKLYVGVHHSGDLAHQSLGNAFSDGVLQISFVSAGF